ncbi:MAG: SpoIIE family protein phosphatase [Candidatus Acidiferrales bacterium]
MLETDGTAARLARRSVQEGEIVPEVTDPYLREQLERRRSELCSALSAGASAAPCTQLLEEVDSALTRMDRGTFGICDVCHDSIEKERLIADPLVTLCLDHLSSAEQRALERDLELAARVQRGLLPQRALRFADWHVHYDYRPAGLVSGDYCDLILPQDGERKLIFLLGDVTGKGVAASLLMTHLHAMFRSLSGVGLELGKLIELANRVFCESTIAGQYATLICGRAADDGFIELASAGHFPALHVRRDGVAEIRSTGVPLGMFSKSTYTVETVRLERGDSLVLYTDGISEANSAAGVEYGIMRLSKLAGGNFGASPDRLLAACFEDVGLYSSGVRQADDQTLMVIQRA